MLQREEGHGHTRVLARRNHLILNSHLWQAAERYSLHKLSKRQVFEVVMRIFFAVPSDTLGSLVNEALDTMSGKLVGVQMRLGNEKLWDEPRYAGPVKSVLACFVAQTLKSCGGSCSVFVTSDNDGQGKEFFLSAMQKHNITTAMVPGENLHLDHNIGTAEQHLKTFADWMLLTKMHTLVSSRSGFSETAAWFANIPARALVRPRTCLFSDSVELPDGADA